MPASIHLADLDFDLYKSVCQDVFDTFDGECAYCGAFPVSFRSSRKGRQMTNTLTIDHIIPLSSPYGTWDRWNLAPACKRCNGDKQSSDLIYWWRPQEFWTPALEARFRVRFRRAMALLL